MPFLPEQVFRRRIESEYSEMKNSGSDFETNADKTEYKIRLKGKSLQRTDGIVSQRDEHEFRITLNRDYPYAGGMEIIWLTPIFHPNIRENDGKVCIQLVNDWMATQTVVSVVKGIEHLLANPNPQSPLNKEAAEYYERNPEAMRGNVPELEKPKKPRIVF